MAEAAEIETCCMTECLNGERQITKSDCRIEVCTVMPEKLQKGKFMVNWSKTGDAVFHYDCWSALLQSARARNQKRARFVLSSAEKTMLKEAGKTAEKHDGIDTVLTEGQRVSELIKGAKHCLAFTGAGISTSAGIGDYRGKSGKWTQDERATVNVDCDAVDEPSAKKQRTDHNSTNHIDEDTVDDDDVESEGVPYEKLRPTYTHEALQKLMELGHLKHIISQNGDGLHRLSGVKDDEISELHGNVFLEKCEVCGHVYERDVYVLDDAASQYYEELEDHGKATIKKPRHAVRCELCGLSHRTGRKCSQKGCKGQLKDTIINFQDNLEAAILDTATEHAETCDLMLCLGTTLRVTPACDLVEMGMDPLRLVICNRQKTPLDNICVKKDAHKQMLGARVFGDCDVFLREIMKGILSHDALQKWEDQRGERMKIYDSKRS